jgi:hypothetical protein
VVVTSEAPGGEGLLDERRDPTTTLLGWRRFVDGPTPRFELLPEPE